MIYHFIRVRGINKIPLNGLNSIAARSFTRSSILNNIFRRSVNYLESGSIVHINSKESQVTVYIQVTSILLDEPLGSCVKHMLERNPNTMCCTTI